MMLDKFISSVDHRLVREIGYSNKVVAVHSTLSDIIHARQYNTRTEFYDEHGTMDAARSTRERSYAYKILSIEVRYWGGGIVEARLLLFLP